LSEGVKHFGKPAPVAAVAGAISFMACCLPFGIAAASVGSGPGRFLEHYRPYLMAASGALLLFGAWRFYRRGASRSLRSRATIIVCWIFAVAIALMMILPQIVTEFLADL
jgi:cation transport ATPase